MRLFFGIALILALPFLPHDKLLSYVGNLFAVIGWAQLLQPELKKMAGRWPFRSKKKQRRKVADSKRQAFDVAS